MQASMSSSSTTGAEPATTAKDYVGRLSGGVTSADGEEEAHSSSDAGAELELGLSLGARNASGPAALRRGRRCWLLTAKDLPRLPSPRSSSPTYSATSSSSVSSWLAASSGAGTKRTATEAVSPHAGGGSPLPASSNMVVGWPPVRAFRMNSFFNHSKDETTAVLKKANHHGSRGEDKAKAAGNGDGDSMGGTVKAAGRSLFFVKVNMEGDPIGRKVDLSVHHCYKTLGIELENMFQKPTNSLACSNEGLKASKLLYASSEFYLTYEDKDGDWMLAGDVPWEIFLDTVKRLRILRTCDASGLVPKVSIQQVFSTDGK